LLALLLLLALFLSKIAVVLGSLGGVLSVVVVVAIFNSIVIVVVVVCFQKSKIDERIEQM